MQTTISIALFRSKIIHIFCAIINSQRHITALNCQIFALFPNTSYFLYFEYTTYFNCIICIAVVVVFELEDEWNLSQFNALETTRALFL